MVVVEAVAAVTDPTFPARLLASHRFRVVETDNEHGGLDILERSSVRW